MELSGPQRQRRVRMAQQALEMQVLSSLPRSPDAMHRYAGLKRRRLARVIQVWFRRLHAARVPACIGAANTTTSSATSFSGGLPSDVSGVGTARGDQSFIEPALNESLGGSVYGGCAAVAQAVGPAATFFSALVGEPQLEAVERRILARASAAAGGLEGGEGLDGLRDRSDVLLAARARRAAARGSPEAAHFSRAQGCAALLATAQHLAAPPLPDALLGRALEGQETLRVASSAFWGAGGEREEYATAAAAAAENLPPPLHGLPPPYKAALLNSLAWPPACRSQARATAAAAHAAAMVGINPNKPWWHTTDPRFFDVRTYAYGWPSMEPAVPAALSSAAIASAVDIREGRPGWRSITQQAHLPPSFNACQPVCVAPVTDPLFSCGGLEQARIILDAPPPHASPTFQRPSPAALGKRGRTDWDEKEASNTWLRLVCSPLAYSTEIEKAAAASNSSSSQGFDGTLARAAHILGVPDPWATSAALIDPTAVTAAVRAAAAAEQSVQQQQATIQGGMYVDIEGVFALSSAAAAAAQTTGSSSSSSSSTASGPTQPLEDLINLTAELYAFAPLNLRAEGLAEALGIPGCSAGRGDGGGLPFPSLATPELSVGGRIEGMFQVLRRQVVCADALLCLEGEDERGRVDTGKDSGGGSSGPSGTAAASGFSSASGSMSVLGRPPMASLAALTREVRARCIQRAWKTCRVVRAARAQLAARRKKRAEGGRSGRLRVAVMNLVRELEASGVSMRQGGQDAAADEEEEGGEEAAAAAPYGARELLAALPLLSTATSRAAKGRVQQQQQQLSSARPPLAPISATSAVAAPPPSSASSTASSLRRSTFIRYSERDAVAAAAGATASLADSATTSRPVILIQTRAPTPPAESTLDSSLGLIVLKREGVVEFPPIVVTQGRKL